MKLDNQTLALIAIGASVAANCQPCLEHNVNTAQKCGADGQEIAEAIEVGKRVRQGAASKMDAFAANLNQAIPMAVNAASTGCGCGAPVTAMEGKNE